ncbi:MAG: hypothetical protein S4CHLAM2_14890 [Chlamydiales bacterium]|nr:hypothetical protein [Chlamydiales bacterium]
MTTPIERHLQQKLANHGWLQGCLDGDTGAFPYRLSSERPPQLNGRSYFPLRPPKTLPQVPPGPDPLYLVNVPLGLAPNVTEYTSLQSLVKLFREEAFGATTAESKAALKGRFALVVGINRMRSLDPALNRQFAPYISQIPRMLSIVYRIFGFLWNPVWEKQISQDALYSPQKAFMLIKAHNVTRAEAVRAMHETEPPIVPFQRIRERIKRSDETRLLVHHFENGNSSAPIYYGVMDADCQQMRTTTGLFSRFDSLIEIHGPLSAFSLGYRVSEKERPIIRLGVEIDMKIREAMNSVIPYSGYFPEPGSIFCIRTPFDSNKLDSLSFLGAGQGLECRRLIQNGLATGALKRKVHFSADGGVETKTPKRMKTENNARITELTRSKLKEKRSLRALRHTSQSHLKPKQWADNLYASLTFPERLHPALRSQGNSMEEVDEFAFRASRVTNVTTPMMHLFSLYDPISRAFSEQGVYSARTFDRVMDTYGAPLSDGQQNLRLTARESLAAQQMRPMLVDRIEEAAKQSGAAIHSMLKSTVANLS